MSGQGEWGRVGECLGFRRWGSKEGGGPRCCGVRDTKEAGDQNDQSTHKEDGRLVEPFIACD